MYLFLFAHGDEFHSENTSELEHTLTSGFVAVPLFILLLGAVYYLMTHTFKLKLPHTLLVIMAVNFIVGVLTFSLVPAVSVLAITFGILLALFFSLSSLA